MPPINLKLKNTIPKSPKTGLSSLLLLKTNIFISIAPKPYIPNKYNFEQQQAMAFAFLKAFYNSRELGYNVDRYKYTDVTQEIIDVVNQMAYQIITTARITSVTMIIQELAKAVLDSISINGKFSPSDCIAAFIDFILFNQNVKDAGKILTQASDTLLRERAMIRKSFLGNAVLIQILNREKGYIELKFNGF